MVRKVLIAVVCVFAVAVAWSGWSAYQNKQRFETVMSEQAKDQSAHR